MAVNKKKIGAKSSKQILRTVVICNIETRIKPIFYMISATLPRSGIQQTKEQIHSMKIGKSNTELPRHIMFL
jgi:hypothetical protein